MSSTADLAGPLPGSHNRTVAVTGTPLMIVWYERSLTFTVALGG